MEGAARDSAAMFGRERSPSTPTAACRTRASPCSSPPGPRTPRGASSPRTPGRPETPGTPPSRVGRTPVPRTPLPRTPHRTPFQTPYGQTPVSQVLARTPLMRTPWSPQAFGGASAALGASLRSPGLPWDVHSPPFEGEDTQFANASISQTEISGSEPATSRCGAHPVAVAPSAAPFGDLLGEGAALPQPTAGNWMPAAPLCDQSALLAQLFLGSLAESSPTWQVDSLSAARVAPAKCDPPVDLRGALAHCPEHLVNGLEDEGRFAQNFTEATAIAKGEFSTVYRARNKTDQHLYAVKVPTEGVPCDRSAAHREAFALAAIAAGSAGCQHLVRYFSSWIEDGQVHIQTELCECSLRDRMAERLRTQGLDPRFGETALADVLRHVALGLATLHGLGFAHLDVKPDNILVGTNGVYKLTDLGLVASLKATERDSIIEGDCRYLAMEILRGDLTDLPKADVFCMGVVAYELATNPRPLPCNGDEWQALRQGDPDRDLLPLSERVKALLCRMLSETPGERPACGEVASFFSVAPEDELQALRAALAEAREASAQSSRLAEEYRRELMVVRDQDQSSSGTLESRICVEQLGG